MNINGNDEIELGFKKAVQFTKSHYENFPVLSIFVKKELRKFVAIIYQFARQADDIADEGTSAPNERLKKLNYYEDSLKKSLNSDIKDDFWKALKFTIHTKNLTSDNFFSLLKAFKQDVLKNSYQDYDELLDYCNKSANPVGRIILELNNIRDSDAFSYSDKICTALQLSNFWQDVKIDLEKERIYLPINEMNMFNYSSEDLRGNKYNDQFTKLLKYEIDRTKKLFEEGRNILSFLPFGLRIQILTTIKGGELILRKIEENNYNVFFIRPTITKFEFLKLFLSSIIFGK